MMGETGPMGLHSKGRKTDMKTAAKRERKTLRIVELALLLGAAAFLMTGVWALTPQRDLAGKVVRLQRRATSQGGCEPRSFWSSRRTGRRQRFACGSACRNWRPSPRRRYGPSAMTTP